MCGLLYNSYISVYLFTKKKDTSKRIQKDSPWTIRKYWQRTYLIELAFK